MSKKRILLTGGCGFIGHHVCQHFLEKTDWKIVILDSLTYAGDVGRVSNQPWYDPDRVSIHWHDLRAPIQESLINRIGHIDYVVNLASESHVERSIADPVTFVHNNVMLILHMLEYVRQTKPDKFLHISTDEVFGPAPLDYFFKEWDRHVPSNPYAASKSAQEAIAASYWRTYNVPLIITATMNNFGERQHGEKLIPKCIKHIVNGQPMPIYSENTETGWVPGSRVWLHAKNHADALLFILNTISPSRFPESDRPSKFNIAGDREISNLDVLFKIAGIMKKVATFNHVDFHSSRPGHDMRYALDGSKIRDHGWIAPLDMDESFERTVKWYQENCEWL